ncbi:LuxR C-terminal-related transcriptional regulator [Streptomyces scabiei]|uniref:helix-turn-helix domain-containing protein n=1 Tax=Streptomyces scabiei TaxID=1930 RepID=UPI000765AA7B|nr:LuxR C-terminal-related transcriptional regulator [Streptomyces scabiei]MDX2658299.1 LuxR C-terminal-related transcriptional regulator [Streptomyces scabiei]MDX2870584.1 LuxR C-terminal-related transcriptional regulator [Streptomyces scabiei]MDX2996409.1 LuxR C-terminal-related transcriptional regulator [Streptomyces scabiei]MDX3049880.1 LuxR C-terminal-related transcriptional regulator [Streptomyces scabiei]MDX3174157.1 LuxR C-terminal-related transcriptional regulator [Streptomyces scabie
MTAPVQDSPAPSGAGPVPPAPPVRDYPAALTVEPRTYLTGREREALLLAANGHTNRAIGRALGLGEETVKTRMRKILRKLRVNDRAQAVAVALRLGVLSLDDITVPEGANAGYRDSA